MKKHREKIGIFILIMAIITTIAGLGWVGGRIARTMELGINCKQYIERAAYASDVKVAKENLSKAIEYAEKNNLTSGTVSVFLKQPKNDVGFWYNNLKEAYKELEKVSESSTNLESSNVLMKLKDKLMHENEGSLYVTMPNGLDVYPHNVIWFWSGWILLIAIFTLWIVYLYKFFWRFDYY